MTNNNDINKKDNFNEEVLDLRRVTRVVQGGKRFRFRATVVIGDGNGRVGIGVAKGADVEQAVNKGKVQARKALIKIKMKERTIPHEVEAKFSAARVLIKPSAVGKGLTAGGAVRVVLKLAGIQDATAKCLGTTTNKLTNALATVRALSQLSN